MEKPKIHQTIEKATGECPDCGWKRAIYRFIRSHDPDGNLDRQYHHVVIECSHCNYYEFSLQEGEP